MFFYMYVCVCVCGGGGCMCVWKWHIERMENDTHCHSVKVQGFIICTVIERVKQLHLSAVGASYQRTRHLSKGQNEHPLSFSQPSFSVFTSFWLLSSVLSGGFNSTMNKCNIENVILMHNALTLALCVPSEMFSNSWQRCFAKISCLSNVWF